MATEQATVVEQLDVVQNDKAVSVLSSKIKALPQDCRAPAFSVTIYLERIRRQSEDALIAADMCKRAYTRLITTGSKGLDRREDRALSNFCLACTSLLENTEPGDARALATLRLIRVVPTPTGGVQQD